MKLEHFEFYREILDSLSDHIAVIDIQGNIVYVNDSWKQFFSRNTVERNQSWSGVNYLNVCKKSAESGDLSGHQAYSGIQAVINQDKSHFYFEYPCHNPTVKRWFMMRVKPLRNNDLICFYVISHHDITERKLMEEQMREQSRTDGLTALANRREFDRYLSREWKRCCRNESGIALLIIDLDHFKKLNDSLGHQYGDECLKKMGQVLMGCANRANELCARYGGEEFAVIIGETEFTTAIKIAQHIHKALNHRAILHPQSESGYLTASIGVAYVIPQRGEEEDILIRRADEALYEAKNKGRNRTEYTLRNISLQNQSTINAVNS